MQVIVVDANKGVEEMEEELEAERQARGKAERQRSDMVREMESLGDRFNHSYIQHIIDFHFNNSNKLTQVE